MGSGDGFRGWIRGGVRGGTLDPDQDPGSGTRLPGSPGTGTVEPGMIAFAGRFALNKRDPYPLCIKCAKASSMVTRSRTGPRVRFLLYVETIRLVSGVRVQPVPVVRSPDRP